MTPQLYTSASIPSSCARINGLSFPPAVRTAYDCSQCSGRMGVKTLLRGGTFRLTATRLQASLSRLSRKGYHLRGAHDRQAGDGACRLKGAHPVIEYELWAEVMEERRCWGVPYAVPTPFARRREAGSEVVQPHDRAVRAAAEENVVQLQDGSRGRWLDQHAKV